MIKRSGTDPRRRLPPEAGEIAIEYALIAGALAVALVAGLAATTDGLATAFARVAAAFPN